jgi:hypothetical protein
MRRVTNQIEQNSATENQIKYQVIIIIIHFL